MTQPQDFTGVTMIPDRAFVKTYLAKSLKACFQDHWAEFQLGSEDSIAGVYADLMQRPEYASMAALYHILDDLDVSR